ncbi:MAG: hypothetical protein AAF213_05720 [Pseudomonadota bacterium]
MTTRNWSITGFTMAKLPFKRLALGEQEDVQLQFMVDGMEVRFPALIEVTRTNQRRREIGCRFLMIDPRGERLMRQYLELHGQSVSGPQATAEAPRNAAYTAPDNTPDQAAAPDNHEPVSEPSTASEKPQEQQLIRPAPVMETQPYGGFGQHDAGYDRDEEEEFVNPLILVYRALRGRWLYATVLACIASILMVTASYFMIKPVYQSRGLIRIAAKEQKILYSDRDDSRLRLFDAFVSSELTYLTSRPVLDRAIYILGQQPGQFADSPQSVADLAGRLEARKIKSLLELTAASVDQDSAKAMVDAVLDGYQQLQVEQNDRQQTIRERELIAREQELLSRIDALKANLLAVGGEYNMVALRRTHQNRLDQIEESRDKITEINASIEQLNTQGVIVGGGVDVQIQRAVMLDRNLADLSFERTKRAATLTTLRERYAGSHPLVMQATTELRVVDDAIEDRLDFINQLGSTGGLSGAAAPGEGPTVESLQAQLVVQEKRVGELKSDATDLNAKLLEVGTLNAELTEHQDMLQETRRVLEQIRVESRNSLPGTIEILSRGSFPERPAVNRRKSAAMLAVVAAFGMTGMGFIGFSLLQRRARYSDELDNVDGIEMLGVIDRLQDLEGMAPPLISQIRAELEIGTLRHPTHARAFIIGRVNRQTDTALLTMQLANSFAATQMQTLVIDGDPTTGRLTELSQAYFQKNQAQGKTTPQSLDDLMSSPIQLDEQLSIIPGGGSLGSGQATLSAEAAQNMIKTNRDNHDCVLYQGCVLTDDVMSRFVASNVDGVILVIDRNQKIADIQREVDAAKRLTRGRVFGVFVNAAVNDPGLRHGRTAQTTIHSLEPEAA